MIGDRLIFFAQPLQRSNLCASHRQRRWLTYLSYNVVVLLALTTSAFGSFLLATHLTGQPLAGMVAGLVFAYCPFMFDHLSHPQVLSAGGIPMTLFFLHRFQETQRTSTLLLCALFYLLQVFANGALYLTMFAGLLLLSDIAARNR